MLSCGGEGTRVTHTLSVVVFGKQAPRPADLPAGGWVYAGQVVPRLTEFRYLGIVFHQTRGMSVAVSTLRNAGLRAMWGMLGRCGDVGLHSLQVKVNLFDALVAPVLSFGAEIWGPNLLRNCRTPLGCMDNDLHGVQSMFMRQLGGGLRRSTPRQLLLREFGCKPLVRGWIQAMTASWNRMIALPASSLLKVAFTENVEMGAGLPSGWFSGFSALLSVLGCVPEGGLCPQGEPVQLGLACVLDRFDTWFYSCWTGLPADPRTAPSAQVACCKYQHWFAVQGGHLSDPLPLLDRGRWPDQPAYVRYTAGITRSKVRALSSFRLAAHDLEIECMKWRRERRGGRVVSTAVPRERRTCGLCWGDMGDELHMVMRCSGYTAVRHRHPRLFSRFGGCQEVTNRSITPAQFRAFMNQDPVQVAAFIHECAQRRWDNPPDELLFADCDQAESDSFHDAYSEEYYDVVSEVCSEASADVFFDCLTP